MNIILLGSGNVATHLGQALKTAGHNILQVWSRNNYNATILANQLAAEPLSSISSLNPTADLYIIAVKDDAIHEVAGALSCRGQLVVHTSGSTDLSVLEGVSLAIGVLYPIQTFSKAKDLNFKEIPIAIEANTSSAVDLLHTIARSITSKVVRLDSEHRAVLHTGAVFACNFTNHLYAIAQHVLEQKQLDFDLLRPLIDQTAQKVKTNDPENVQTGPAVRGDSKTMNKHIELLKNNPEYLEVYRLLSQSIINSQHKKQTP